MIEWAQMMAQNGDYYQSRKVYSAAIRAIPSRAVIYSAWHRMERLIGQTLHADALLTGGVNDLLKAGDLQGLHAWALQEFHTPGSKNYARHILKKMTHVFGATQAYPWQAWGSMEMKDHNYKFARKLFEMALTNDSKDTST